MDVNHEEAPKLRLLFSKKECAAALGVCPRTIDNLIRWRKLRSVSIRRRTMIHVRDLEKLARSGCK
jgi:hypothetical protein